MSGWEIAISAPMKQMDDVMSGDDPITDETSKYTCENIDAIFLS